MCCFTPLSGGLGLGVVVGLVVVGGVGLTVLEVVVVGFGLYSN